MVKKAAFFGALLAVLAFCATTVQAAEGSHTGFGVFGNLNVPVFGLKQWYSTAPRFGAAILHSPGERYSMEVEYLYAPYRGGKIEKKTFVWSVDKATYASPNAVSDMNVQSLLFNFLFRLGNKGKAFSGRGASPYVLAGAGFVGYKNMVSGLAYPYQTKAPFNTNAWPASETRDGLQGGLMEPQQDRRVTVGASFGLGVEKFLSPGMALDLRARWLAAIGNIRPRELWGIKEVMPIQGVDLGIALKFYK